tara:strand:+ start:138 stop:485 length:348 start_codon:yes stop_codon:yes gene_type:complete
MSFRSFDLLNLVRNFGESLTLSKVNADGSYNPTTGTIDGSTSTDHTVLGYFYNYETLNVDQIRKGTRKCVISAVEGIIPDEDDKLLGNGDAVVITSVTTIFSSGSAICFICHVEE